MDKYANIAGLKSFGRALVEAGHFYADKPIELEQEIGIRIGLSTIESLQEMGLQATPCILIDDYSVVDTKSEINMKIIESLGYSPRTIFREKEFKTVALEILKKLEATGLVKDRKRTGEKYLKKDFVKLVKRDGKPTCALLDAALYVQKHEQYDGLCVTVLPDTSNFRIQQKYTRLILKAAGSDVPILNVYFTKESEVSIDFNF